MSLNTHLLSARTTAVNGLMSAGYLLAALFVWKAHSPGMRLGALAVILLSAGFAWLATARRYHLIADTPTSRIASAAQGHVELQGQCEVHAGSQPIGFRSGPPSVWYRYVVRRTHDGKSEVVSSGTSDETFVLADDSGQCIVDPERAEVSGSHRRSWQDGMYSITVHYWQPGDPLYALGELTTIGGADLKLDKRADIAAVMADWKRNPAALKARFDKNDDGEVDVTEWDLARETAAREVGENHRELRLRPAMHLLAAPHDGRPLLLSNRGHESIARRYRWWSWFHVAAFAVAIVVGIMMLRMVAGSG